MNAALKALSAQLPPPIAKGAPLLLPTLGFIFVPDAPHLRASEAAALQAALDGQMRALLVSSRQLAKAFGGAIASQVWSVDPHTGRVGPHSARPEAKASAAADKGPKRKAAQLVLGLADPAAGPVADAPLALGKPLLDDGVTSACAGDPVGKAQHWTLTPEGLLVLSKHKGEKDEEGYGDGAALSPAAKKERKKKRTAAKEDEDEDFMAAADPAWCAGLASTGRIFPSQGSEVVLVPVSSARAIRWDIDTAPGGYR